MGRQESRRRRIFNLWRKDSTCERCKTETTLIFRHEVHTKGPRRIPFRDDEAVLYHVITKIEGRTEEDGHSTILYCRKCAAEASTDKQHSVDKDELRRRSHLHQEKKFVRRDLRSQVDALKAKIRRLERDKDEPCEQ